MTPRTVALALFAVFSVAGCSGGCDASSPSPPRPVPPTPGRTTPFVPQAAAGFDARPRYVFSTADLDGNGTGDSVVTDRTTGGIAVRLFGELPSGHPYAGIDQEACTKTMWQFLNSGDAS